MSTREIIARIRECQTLGECLALANELEEPFVGGVEEPKKPLVVKMIYRLTGRGKPMPMSVDDEEMAEAS